MAEVLFEKLLEEKGLLEDWRVESAGVWAYQGAAATQNAQVVMAERELDLGGHRSQPTDPVLLKQFDIIIVMEVEHKLVLQERNPALADRILTIRELVGGRGDFDDPVGGSVEVYREAADEIYAILEEAYPFILSKTDVT
jgi:protein-tyrosine phosphatase